MGDVDFVEAVDNISCDTLGTGYLRWIPVVERLHLTDTLEHEDRPDECC
jgi:hypothetical protein